MAGLHNTCTITQNAVKIAGISHYIRILGQRIKCWCQNTRGTLVIIIFSTVHIIKIETAKSIKQHILLYSNFTV